MAPRQRLWRIAVLAMLVAALVAVVEWQALYDGGFPAFHDLGVYRGAIEHVSNGGALYEFRYPHYTRPEGYPFTYPPFAALVLWPLSWVSTTFSGTAWAVATMLLCVVLAAFVVMNSRFVTWARPASRRPVLVALTMLVTPVLLLSAPLISHLAIAQVSLAITALAFVDAAFVPPRYRGVLTGLAAGLKLTPLVFLPYFLVTGQRRAFVNSTASFAGTVLLGAVVLPQDSFTYWTSALFETGRVGDPAEFRSKSVLGLLVRWDVPGEQLVWVLLCLVIFAAALWRARAYVRRDDLVAAALVIGCASVALSPISWPHHQAWAVLAGLVMVLHRRGRWVWFGVAVLVAFSGFVPLVNVDGYGSLPQRLAWEIPTLMFIALSTIGLGDRPVVAEAGDETSAQRGELSRSTAPEVPVAD